MSTAHSKANHSPVYFKAPGAGERYRLGNEPDTLVRLRLNYEGQPRREQSSYVKAEVAVEDYQPYGNTRELRPNIIPKLNVTWANINGSGINVWAGRRWYNMKGSHLNKYRWINSGKQTHLGAGIEGLSLANTELKVAAFHHRDRNIPSRLPSNSREGALISNTVDARLSGIPLGKQHRLSIWALSAHREANTALGYKQKTGWGSGFWIVTPDLAGGKNRLGLTYRKGPAITQASGNANPISEAEGYDLNRAHQWEVNNSYRWDDHQRFALEWTLLARKLDYGTQGATGDSINWYSTGAHPLFYLSKHLSLATEVGVDYVENERLGVTGALTKTAIALQLEPAKQYVARHSLRLFASYAIWSDAFVGLIGNSPHTAPYSDDNHGWNLGLQLEHIW